MPNQGPQKCFVIMPFGTKPHHAESGRPHDFDKVYRVVMQRAIRQAGLEPIRADEHKGSSIIHTEMFRDLRDQPVVLADLSLDNPNVFYELGIRHVMSSRGTVLMCRLGADLPFDVKLSRVIFYKYDGANLDWEEAEKTVLELQHALEQAKRGVPDSPVHALLEKVTREEGTERERGSARSTPWAHQVEKGHSSLELYQQFIAETWTKQGDHLDDLIKDHRTSVFGARCLGLRSLGPGVGDDQAATIARLLFGFEQYDLARSVYEALRQRDKLKPEDLIQYASVLSELNDDLATVDQALRVLGEVAEQIEARSRGMTEDAALIVLRAKHAAALAGMTGWRWQISMAREDLVSTIKLHENAVAECTRAFSTAESFPVGRLAQMHLKLMLYRRAKDNDRDRHDFEGHREAVLKLKAKVTCKPVDLSYLRWFQAITLADSGDSEGSHRKSIVAYTEDAKIIQKDGATDVGRRQYTLLRRFLEHNAQFLQNQSLVAHIPQMLQIGHAISD